MNLLQQNVWPWDGGEVGALIRAKDWTQSELGPVEDWPPHLRSMLDGLLATALPCTLLWGDDSIVFYNDAARELMGDRHPKAFGRPITGMGIDLRTDWASLAERVRGGETVTVEDQPYRLGDDGCERRSWFTHYISPLRGQNGDVVGMWAISIDTTARVNAERERNTIGAALRDREERHDFLVKLTEALRPLENPASVQEAASRTLGQHLRTDRVCYCEMLDDTTDFLIERDYHVSRVPSAAGRHRLSEFGQQLIARIRSGETVVVADVRAEAMLNEVERTAHEYVLVRAYVLVALVKEGRLVAMLAAHSSVPRQWTPAEVELVEETAERTWAAVGRSRAEAALRASEKRFRVLADAVPQIVWVTDFQGNVQFLNKQWSSYTGFPQEEFAHGKIFTSYVHPDDAESAASAFDLARWTGSGYRAEFRLRGADGSYRWFMARAQPYRDPVTGVISQWFGVSVDIHEHRLTEARLRRSEEMFQQFGNASSSILWMRDAGSLQWTYLTPAFERIYGLSREEALQGDNFRGWQDLILPEDRKRVEASVRRVIAGEHVTFEYRIRRPSDGKIRWLRDTDFPVLDEAGRVQSIGGIGEDITETRESSDRLHVAMAELQRRTGSLLGTVGAMADNTLEDVTSLQDFSERFRGRMDALARAHSILARIDRGDVVTFGDVLDSEIRAAGLRHADAAKRIRREGPDDLALSVVSVPALALALHGLMVDALRDGALATPEGSVHVRWQVQQSERGPHLSLTWIERGAAAMRSRSQIGREQNLIDRMLRARSNAETRYRMDEAGVEFSILLPLGPGWHAARSEQVQPEPGT